MLHSETGSIQSIADAQRRCLVHRITEFIDEHLPDPHLSPGMIADAHHISLRYLHKLFETQEKTVAAWIRHRRLENCRNDLMNPAIQWRPVSAIAARWGLTDSASFNRMFRVEYGVPPGEFRRMSA
jgi:AraC-like DNA-binding protein